MPCRPPPAGPESVTAGLDPPAGRPARRAPPASNVARPTLRPGGEGGTLAPVDRLSLAELDARAVEIDTLVGQTPGADRWCSTVEWSLPAHLAFAPQAEPLILHGDGAAALLARYRTEDGITVIGGLEPLWGFACPLLGPDPRRTAARVTAALLADRDWDALVLSGLPPHRPLLMDLAQAMRPLGRGRLAEGITRQVADLDADLDAFWARRGSHLRRNVRRAQRQARQRGLRIDDVSDDPDLLARVLRIEHRSWKGRAGDGLASPTMARFYELQLDRLRRHRRIRAMVARLDDVEVGFIIGGRHRDLYRGLQLSFAEEVRSLSVGHLLQSAELARLAGEGVRTYDLGMDLEYKRSWADRAVRTVTLVITRVPPPGA